MFLLPHTITTTTTTFKPKNNTVVRADAEDETDVNHPALTTHKCTIYFSFARYLDQFLRMEITIKLKWLKGFKQYQRTFSQGMHFQMQIYMRLSTFTYT